VLTASSVQEGIAVAATVKFDVVISDIGLPDASGLDLMVQLKSEYPHLKGIALTGYGMEEDVKKSTAAGFSVHLIKPIQTQRLQAAIKEVAAL